MTLTRRHIYNAGVTVEDVESGRAPLQAELPYCDELASILQGITAAEKKWCIVTFGQPNVVRAYLRAMGFPDDQTEVPPTAAPTDNTTDNTAAAINHHHYPYHAAPPGILATQRW